MNESAFHFGEFRLLPAQRELWCSGRLLNIQPKVLETLTYLVQNRDRAVGRDELIAAVWGRADITDNVLGQIVGRARAAVGDTGDTQHSIRTAPRFGYRWVREVEVPSALPAISDEGVGDDTKPADDDHPASMPAEAVSNGRTRNRPPWLLPAAALLLLSVAGLAAWWATAFVIAGQDESATVANTTQTAEQDPDTTDSLASANEDKLARVRAALASDRLDLARTLLGQMPDQDRVRPEVRHEAAVLALKERRIDEALGAFTSLLADLGNSGGNLLVVGKAAYGAGQAEFYRGNVETAQRHYQHAIDALHTGTDADARATRGRAWSGLGILHARRHEFDEAERAYAQARIALESTDDHAALAMLESNVGVMLIFRYRHAEALPRFQRAADLTAQTGDASGEARARMNLANVHLQLLQPAEALASEPRLRELRERIGDPWLAAHIDLVRIRVLTVNGQLGAADLVLRAHAGRPKPADPSVSGFRHVVAAELAFARGALDEGSRDAQAALSSDWYSPESGGLAAYARWRLLMARADLGDTRGLADAAAAADEQNRSYPNDPVVSVYASLARGEAAATQDDVARARAEFERALALAEENRIPFDLVQVAAAYARLLLRHGEVAEASVVADRIAGWADQDFTASLVQLGVYHAIGGEAWRPALARTQRLAGERVVPAALTTPPAPQRSPQGTELAASHVP